MPERRVFLHVGYPKTGTTALQMSLDAARSALAASHIRYPSTAVFRGRHAHLAWSSMNLGSWARSKYDGTTTSAIIQAIEGESATADVIVLSSEEFAYQHPISFAPVLDGLRRLGVLSMVVFLRSQPDAIASMYRQLARNRGYEGSPERFVDDVLGSGVPDPIYGATQPPWDGSLPPYDYEVFLDEWENAVGSLVVRPYDGAAREAIVPAFFAALGLPIPPGVDLTRRENEPGEGEAFEARLVERIREHFASSNARVTDRWLPEAAAL